MNQISNWVKYCLEVIPSKKGIALDLACGKGRHSMFLSSYGYHVLAVDINKENLSCFDNKLIEKKTKDIENLKNWPLKEKKFDIIVVTNFLNRTIFPSIIKSINKGGYLIYETFSEGQQNVGKPSNPDYILQRRELITLCFQLNLIAYEEIHTENPINNTFKQRILSMHV
tara:strand:+ start:2509 stop:3018 length:510 start_codon:yes stop_codon:yes gene_type:complete